MKLRLVLLACLLVAVAVTVTAGCTSKKEAKPPAVEDTLPLPASKVGPSTLQLRPFGDEPPDCGALSENPPPEQPMIVLYSNQCVTLKPAVLTVSHADVSAIPSTSGPEVQVKLRASDGALLAQAAKQHAGQRVALVAFGRVLYAFEMPTRMESGTIAIIGMTPNQAGDLKAALR